MTALSTFVALMLFQELEASNTAQEPSRAAAKHIVALDIGHTPSHPGAISATGIPEYEFNKTVVTKINVALAKTETIQPYIIASSNELTLAGRTRLAAAHGAELFIAIHHDSAQDKYLRTWTVNGKTESYSEDFSGYGVFVSHRNAQPDASLEFAELLGASMAAEGFRFSRHHAEAIKGENREIVDADAGVYRFDDLIVLRTAQMPAALLECGVIVNRVEEKSLLTSERQEKIAQAVRNAVIEYFSTSDHRVPSPIKERQKLAVTGGAVPTKGIRLTPTPLPTTTSKKASAAGQSSTEASKRSIFQRMFHKLFNKQSTIKSPSATPDESKHVNKDE
jgi:N-acetylmuramoyl-L-alanine amidase